MIRWEDSRTHRTNSVVTGEKTWLLSTSWMTTSLCFSYLLILIMGRSLPFGGGAVDGPRLAATLWQADAGVDGLVLCFDTLLDTFLNGDDLRTRVAGLGA